MYSNEDIESAVAAKIISRQAAQALRDHVAGVKKTSAVDEENFRLLTGFNDIFVVMASLLLLGALFFICVYYYQQAWLGGLLVAGASWALAEYFVRQRHMALPAIVLLFTFIFGVGFATVSTLYVIGYLFVGELVAAILTALAALLHWRRFRTPITLAAGLGTVLLYVLMSLNKLLPAVAANVMPYVVFCMGLLAFAGAMYWDISDLRRQTRYSDIAFWLHLLAAPLLVHPVFNIMLADTSLLNIILILTLYVLIASFSLAIDRRALMVSALIYVLIAVSTLLDKTTVVDLSFALTALITGSALLLLSAFWHQSRRFIIRLLPQAVCRYFPPITE